MRKHRGGTRIAAVALAALAVAAGIGACGSSDESSGAAASGTSGGEKLKFAAIVMDTTNPFQATMAEEEQAAAKEHGIDLEVLNGNLNISNQVAQIQQQIAKGVDALLVTAVDPAGIVPALKQANAADIPVVTVNTAVQEGAEVVTFVGADDYQYGLKLGEAVVQAVGEDGKVALVTGQVGTSPEQLRTKGIQETLKKHPGIKIVAKVADDWKNQKSLAAVQDLLSKYPKGQLDAIVAEGPQIYIGAKYAADRGRTDVKFIAGDYPKQVQAGIKAGQVFATVNQDPKLEGRRAVEVAKAWIEGRKEAIKRPNEYIELPIVTKDNVDQFDASWVW